MSLFTTPAKPTVATLIILIGLQGSGKTTFFRRYLSHYLHVSRDKFANNRNPSERERLLVSKALGRGESVVVDNTNPSREGRASLIELAIEHGALCVAYWFDCPFHECVERNEQRQGKQRVPLVGIKATARKLSCPSKDEGFYRCSRVVTKDRDFEVYDLDSGAVISMTEPERKDAFGDRMKLYEMAEVGRRLMPLLPAIARIDGKCFSGYTRALRRPFDERLSRLMIETSRYLVTETGACIGYTQSDEITLAWYSSQIDSQIFFDGRVQKMTSVLASLATAYFNEHVRAALESDAPEKPALFDCRVWNVPNLVEGANVFLWRELDATKNSVSMASRVYYSHKELHQRSSADMQELLFQKGVNWNDYPDFFKRGSYVQRRTVTRAFTAQEIELLPEKHHARSNPELMIERQDCFLLEMPPLLRVTNRPGVIFFGENPLIA